MKTFVFLSAAAVLTLVLSTSVGAAPIVGAGGPVAGAGGPVVGAGGPVSGAGGSESQQPATQSVQKSKNPLSVWQALRK